MGCGVWRYTAVRLERPGHDEDHFGYDMNKHESAKAVDKMTDPFLECRIERVEGQR